MTWSAPMTAVSGAIFTAAQYNAYVRNNLLETAPAKATAANQIFAVTGTNAIASRTPTYARVETSESTTSTTFTGLATTGPLVSVVTGTSAFVMLSCRADSNTTGGRSVASYRISGATTQDPSDGRAMVRDGRTASNACRWGFVKFHTDLTPGTNVFEMRYRTGSGTSTWSARELIVVPF